MGSERNILETQAVLHRALGEIVGSLTVTGDDVVKIHTQTKMDDWVYTALANHLSSVMGRTIKVIRGRFFKKTSINGNAYITTTKEK